MNNLISAAVAATTSIGFLALLVVTLVLALVCRGPYRKARRLKAELDAAKESKQVLLKTLHESYREKALLTFANAQLTGRVRELLLQRRALGFALVFADDEVDRLESEVRSRNRQLLAAHTRNGRQASELLETREALRITTRGLRCSLVTSAFPPAVVSPSAYCVSPVEVYRLGARNPVQFSGNVVVQSSAVIEYNDGSTRALAGRSAPVTVVVAPSRPAPTLLHSTTTPGRVSFSWRRNALNNNEVEFRVNGGRWVTQACHRTSVELLASDNSKVVFEVRNVWDTWPRYSAISRMEVQTTKTA